jgi:diguanylate cyclase (GGDEF)-like protein
MDDAATDDAVVRVAEQLGSVLQRTGRTSDAVGRLGPTEFAIVAAATEASGAERLAERVREAMDAEHMVIPRGADGAARVRIRAGYYAVPDYAESAVDAVEMLVRAAAALRQGAGHGGAMNAPIQAFAGVRG